MTKDPTPLPVEQELTFMECDTCRAKPGSPVLCAGCLHNREVIAQTSPKPAVAGDGELRKAVYEKVYYGLTMSEADYYTDWIMSLIAAQATPKPAVPGDGELKEQTCALLNQAVADLGMTVLFRDQDPIDTAGAGDKNPPYYWTDKFIDLFASQATAALQPIPMVNGLDCPACGHPTLILGNGGYITCSLEGCPNPDYADAATAVQERAAESEMTVKVGETKELYGVVSVTNNNDVDVIVTARRAEPRVAQPKQMEGGEDDAN